MYGSYDGEVKSAYEAWSGMEYFYSPLEGMLVHHRITPSSPRAGLKIWAALSGDKRASREAAPLPK